MDDCKARQITCKSYVEVLTNKCLGDFKFTLEQVEQFVHKLHGALEDTKQPVNVSVADFDTVLYAEPNPSESDPQTLELEEYKVRSPKC